MQFVIISKVLLSFFALKFSLTIILLEKRRICFQIEKNRLILARESLHIVILLQKQGCCVRKQKKFYPFDNMLRNEWCFVENVSKKKEKYKKYFTKCQIVEVLTIKMKNKLWIFFQFAVPLQSQLRRQAAPQQSKARIDCIRLALSLHRQLAENTQ